MRYGRRVAFVFCVLCVLAMTSAAWAGSWGTVCASGCEFASLQEAVDASRWGATIELGPGVYVGNVVLRGALTIRGSGAERTIIDGGLRDAALRLESPLAYRVQLEDLTIRGGDRGWISSGAGEVSLERCVVREAGSGRSLFDRRAVAGRTDTERAAGAGAAPRSGRGVHTLVSSVSSMWEQSTDAGLGGLSDLSSACGSGGGGVTLCHIPPGNPENAQTIVVGQGAVAAHLAHGDLLGACPYECDGVPSPVAQTGQTGCWDVSGNPIACAGTGQDGEYQTGTSVDPRFTDNGDGTVKDNLTGLIWLQNASCFGLKTWTNALTDANTLSDGSCGLIDGSVAGDWRLPNLKELQSLIDYGNYDPAFPAGHPFSGVQSSGYWSSAARVGNARHAWIVYLHGGRVDYGGKIFPAYVWPVRGGQ